jgi:hypothetical protein
MNRAMLVLLVAAAACAGCAAPVRAYRTEVKVSPVGTAHQYMVEVRIVAIRPDGTEGVLTAPKMLVTAGHEAEMKVCDAAERDGVFCKALVKEAAASVEAVTTVTVKAEGRQVLSNSQTISVAK